MAFSVSGIAVGRGIAIGRAWVLAPASLDVPRRSLSPEQLPAEVERFYAAVSAVDEEFERVRQDLGQEVAAELRAFLDLQAVVLHDPLLIEATQERIVQEKCNAEWALVQQYELVAEQFDSIEDAYLRERRHDVRQIVERILKAMRHPEGGHRIALPTSESGSDADDLPWILVAHDIAPADMLLLKQHSFAGFATDTGLFWLEALACRRLSGFKACIALSSRVSI
jgi:phosphotransferase system enzyme I (PtsI)